MKPKLSVVLPALRGYDTVLAALDAWEMQTLRDRLEILILCPDQPGPAASALPPSQVLVPIGSADLHEARAMGIERASGDYVMLAEDHCLPDPGWAQAILERFEEGWDAIGSALRPGHRGDCWTEGSFLIGYGEWMMPVAGGPTKVISGWNCVIRTSVLLQFGAELAGELRLGAFLVRRLQQQGSRLYLEDRALMKHFDPPGWAYEIWLHAVVGMSFGAMRVRRWPLAARILYPLAFPAIAFLHWKRAFTQYRRAGAAAGLRPTAVAAALVFACAWGLGEAAGALLGINRVAPCFWRTEIKPVRREEVARAAAHERLGQPQVP
jgi:glycosyltransferase involved in cell wall biosynthesis